MNRWITSFHQSFRALKTWENLPASKNIWFHAASLGETKALQAILHRLRKHEATSSFSIVISNRSVKTAQQALPQVDSLIDKRVLAPNEFQVRLFLTRLRPSLAIFVESELWPILLHQIKQRDCPLMLINANISETSWRRWNSTSFSRLLLKKMLSSFDFIHAQNADQAYRIQTFLDKKSVDIPFGSIKPASTALGKTQSKNSSRPEISNEVSALLNKLQPGWSAISTHDGETELLIEAHRLFVQTQSQLKGPLIIVPRHPLDDVIKEVIPNQVYILSEIGIVDRVCEWTAKGSKLVLIGGSLPTSKHKGGHNIFEPLLHGCEILHGPHMSRFKDDLDNLDLSLRHEIHSSQQLAETLGRRWGMAHFDYKTLQTFHRSEVMCDLITDKIVELLTFTRRST